MRTTLAMLCLALGSSANGQPGATDVSPFDPSSYLLEQHGAERADAWGLKARIVEIHGQRYRKYENENGVLYVPILSDKAKPDKALCVARGEEVAWTSEEVFIGWQEKETDTVSLDLRVIGQVLRQACTGKITGVKLVRNPLEIGITVRAKGKDGDRKVRIFNRGLQPNIGVGTEF